MSTTIDFNLTVFCEQQQISSSHFGSICTLIYITRQAKLHGLPLRADRLASRSGGQVAGLHQGAVRAILDDYGVTYDSLGEAGRTNPGSLSYALAYASLLNSWPNLDRQSLAVIERWWVQRLPSRPDAGAFRLHWRPNSSVRWPAEPGWRSSGPSLICWRRWTVAQSMARQRPSRRLGSPAWLRPC